MGLVRRRGTYDRNHSGKRIGTAGGGQIAAQQLGQQGQAAATNAGNIDVNLGEQTGQNLMNAATATASGYVGAGNALSGGINSFSQLALLQNSRLLNGTANDPYGSSGINPESYPANYPYGS